jgi:hypothetical protein
MSWPLKTPKLATLPSVLRDQIASFVPTTEEVIKPCQFGFVYGQAQSAVVAGMPESIRAGCGCKLFGGRRNCTRPLLPTKQIAVASASQTAAQTTNRESMATSSAYLQSELPH